jgi:hypothetical protein
VEKRDFLDDRGVLCNLFGLKFWAYRSPSQDKAGLLSVRRFLGTLADLGVKESRAQLEGKPVLQRTVGTGAQRQQSAVDH